MSLSPSRADGDQLARERAQVTSIHLAICKGLLTHEGTSADMIGKIARVPLRDVWQHEAYDLTRWLEQNMDVLSDAVGLPLANPEREQAAGTFSVDLVAEDAAGNPVVIENQLGKTDHDHLGKLLTYMVAVGAKTAIWVAAEPRSEHVSTVAWLNESSAASFYLLKIEAIRIGDSPPAPLLTLVVGPSEEARAAGTTKKELAERHLLRQRFWAALLERAKGRTNLHAGISPSRWNWIGAGAGHRELSYNYVIRQHEAVAELYIDRGNESDEENRRIFEEIQRHQAPIEASVGGPLEWDCVEGRRACRIRVTIKTGGYRDSDTWPTTQDDMIEAMSKLEKALAPHVAGLKI
jgi:hypothetical protein